MGAPPPAGDAGKTEAAIQAVAPDEEWPKGLLLAAYSSPRLAFETLKLMYPELVQYRGGWFRADDFGPTMSMVSSSRRKGICLPSSSW